MLRLLVECVRPCSLDAARRLPWLLSATNGRGADTDTTRIPCCSLSVPSVIVERDLDRRCGGAGFKLSGAIKSCLKAMSTGIFQRRHRKMIFQTHARSSSLSVGLTSASQQMKEKAGALRCSCTLIQAGGVRCPRATIPFGGRPPRFKVHDKNDVTQPSR